MSKRPVIVVAPGRGSYNRSELGSLASVSGEARHWLDAFDAHRRELGQPTVGELDSAASFAPEVHQTSVNASALTFAASYADFCAIDRERFEIVAVTGNSMGWYTALACGGALDPVEAFDLANAMGSRMESEAPGGQMLHRFVDDGWRPIPGREAELRALIADIADLYLSIELGGMIVVAGSEAALATFAARAPKDPGYPLRLPYHAAFHSPLVQPVSEWALASLVPAFTQPSIPMIDGRGHVWRGWMSDTEALRQYTLGHQVTRPYDFTHAMSVAVREFAPEAVIVLGPGGTLGGAAIQSLIAARWRGLADRQSYLDATAEAPFVVSMGRPEQREMVTA